MMVLGKLLELALTVTLLVWIGTQILVPLLKGTRLFPIFHKRRTELEDRLEATRTRLDEDSIEDTITRLRERHRLGRADWNWRDDYHDD